MPRLGILRQGKGRETSATPVPPASVPSGQGNVMRLPRSSRRADRIPWPVARSDRCTVRVECGPSRSFRRRADDRAHLTEYGPIYGERGHHRRNRPPATTTLGGIAVASDRAPPTPPNSLVSPPHTAGPVDIVVTNPGGGSQKSSEPTPCRPGSHWRGEAGRHRGRQRYMDRIHGA
jgi:hypothetical protein